MTGWYKTKLPPDHKVTVCAACKCASCWQGEFYCDKYKTASTIEMTIEELRKLRRENECYWEPKP